MASKRTQRDVKCDAFVVKHTTGVGGEEYLVRPSVAVIDGKDGTATFRIRNVTDQQDVEVDMNGKAIGDNKLRLGHDKHEFLEFHINPTESCFEYAVTINGHPVKGESDPVIIIDPPAN